MHTTIIARRLTISHFDTNLWRSAKPGIGEGERPEILLFPFYVVASRGANIEFVNEELENLSSRPYLLLKRYEYSAGFILRARRFLVHGRVKG